MREMFAAADALERLCQNKANERNQAYDRFGMDNTAESICPVEMRLVKAVKALAGE